MKRRNRDDDGPREARIIEEIAAQYGDVNVDHDSCEGCAFASRAWSIQPCKGCEAYGRWEAER